MSQQAMTTKHTLTVLTGTAGITFDVAGRDEKQVLTWRQIKTVGVPQSDCVLTHTAKWAPKGDNWVSSLSLLIPSMETLSTGGSSAGYVATPKRSALSYFDIKVKRNVLLSQTDALISLDNLAYALLTDAKLRASVVGSVIADA
jgi:hypothetical protein